MLPITAHNVGADYIGNIVVKTATSSENKEKGDTKRIVMVNIRKENVEVMESDKSNKIEVSMCTNV